MRVIFMGTPAFSVAALDAVVAAGHEVVAAYCQPPRPAGRGKQSRPSAVQERAEALGIAVRYPVSLKGEAAQAEFAGFGADVAIVVAYGLILQRAVLAAPRSGCLNIHASLLPRWRGAAPVHRAIMAGDAQTGVCIMQMDEGLDTGPVLMRRAVTIGAQETTGELLGRLATLGATAVVDTLAALPNLVPVPQSDVGVTYAAKIDKAESRIDWSLPAPQVDRLIRGLSPFPGAWDEVSGERVKFLESRVVADARFSDTGVSDAWVAGTDAAGTVRDGFTVVCGAGAVEITRVQRAGKRAMAARDALQGWRLPDRL